MQLPHAEMNHYLSDPEFAALAQGLSDWLNVLVPGVIPTRPEKPTFSYLFPGLTTVWKQGVQLKYPDGTIVTIYRNQVGIKLEAREQSGSTPVSVVYGIPVQNLAETTNTSTPAPEPNFKWSDMQHITTHKIAMQYFRFYSAKVAS